MIKPLSENKPYFQKTISFFLFLIILLLFLYIPLRFGVPGGGMVPLLLYGFIIISLFLNFLSSGKHYFSHQLDFIMMFFCIFLLMHCVIFGKLGETISLIRMFILPAMLYFLARSHFKSIQHIKVVVCAFLLGSLYTSIDFIYQFYYSTILRLGQVPYMKKYILYTSTLTTNEMTGHPAAFKTDEFIFFRLFGSMGYNHVTALGITILVLFSVLFLFDRFASKYSFYAIFFLTLSMLVSVFALFVSSARTIIASTILILTFIFRSNYLLLGLIISILSLMILILPSLFPHLTLLVDFLFSTKRIGSDVVFLSNHSDITSFLQQLLESPFSLFFGNPAGQEVLSNDLYYIEFISAYGLIGFGIFTLILMQVGIMTKQLLHTKYRTYGLFFSSIIFLILLSSLHSGVIKYVQITPLLFISIGIISAMNSLYELE